MLRAVLRQLAEHRHKESAEVTAEKRTIEKELQAIAQEMKETVTVAAGSDVATRRLAELQDRVSQQSSRLADLQQQLTAIEAEGIDSRDVEMALQEFDPLWEQLSTWEQEQFIRILVEQVRYEGKAGTVTLGFYSRGIKELCSWSPALTVKHEQAKQRR